MVLLSGVINVCWIRQRFVPCVAGRLKIEPSFGAAGWPHLRCPLNVLSWQLVLCHVGDMQKSLADAVAKRYRPWSKGLRTDSLPWFDFPLVQGASDCGVQMKLKSQRPGHTGRKALATKKRRHAKNSFCKSCEAESSVFFQLGLDRLDAPLGAGFAIFVAAICPTWRKKLWAFRVPFLGAYFVPVFGAGHIDARSRGSFFGPAIRTPIQGQKQSSERAS